ncbi:Hypothetical protein LUCI_0743 [Lucifera butyrica]|uniref:PglD N-terminal domain-containing protein n=1 Tax=Lucifera butyrica TaxID=1351585 RepID=A0A498R5R2_9FIRM|nr:acetyltransferase [Lucifera butyrica]VBB05533.1 Hypothetical protein LUCI_0743 [Lucifera butyrica]
MNKPVIILGAGGHARVLIDMLRLRSVEIIGVTDADPAKKGTLIAGLPMLGTDQVIANYQPEEVRLVNGLGSVGLPTLRRQIFTDFKRKGYSFLNVIHPSAVLAADIALEEGVQVMAGAVVQPGCRIGANTILNTGAIVDHDCRIGAHVHVAPGVTLSGGVRVGDAVHIGTGAIIIQGIDIGHNSLIAAGAVVVKNVSANVKVAGMPAREVQ